MKIKKSTLKFVLGLALVFSIAYSSSGAERKWHLLKGVELIENYANDADSFWVTDRSGDKHKFRLYFCDAAETRDRPEWAQKRLEKQGDYWDIDPDAALRMGHKATRFVEDLLNDESFAIYTRWQDAMGQGHKRYYALLRFKEKYLSEILVSNGLVRIYDHPLNLAADVELPTGERAGELQHHLEQLERAAKANRRGGWGEADPPEKKRATFQPRTIKLKYPIFIYSLKTGRKCGLLHAGAEVKLLKREPNAMLRVRFKKAKNKFYEAQCRENSLRHQE